MNIRDQFFIIKSKLFEKSNIILIIILTIILLALLSCLTIIQFSVENKKEINNFVDSRTLIVYPKNEQLKEVEKLEHIELLVSNKYGSSTFFEISDFDQNGEKGEINIKPLLKHEDVKIKHGNNLNDDYEIVCSDTFYPYTFEDKIHKNLFIEGKKIIGKEINVFSENEDFNNKEMTLKIVGTYKNKYMEEANTCYVNIPTYDKISSKYSGRVEAYDIAGNSTVTYSEYNGYLLRVDSINNISEVSANLNKLNVEYGKRFIVDSGILDMLYTIPFFVGMIIIVLTLLILRSFIIKKNTSRLNNIGMLKALGYQDKTITNNIINENIIVLGISLVFSFLIYYIVLSYLKYSLLSEVTYNNYILNIPYLLILIFILGLILIIRLIVVSNLKAIFKLDIKTILGNK